MRCCRACSCPGGPDPFRHRHAADCRGGSHCHCTLMAGTPHALWLGCYPDGSLRSGNRVDRRYRHRLPALPWLRDCLSRLGGAGWDADVLRDLGGGCHWSSQLLQTSHGGFPILALVRIYCGDCCHEHSPLVDWGAEGWVQRHYHAYPLDGHCVRI